MTCCRCNKRLTIKVAVDNGGYCESCLLLVAQEIVTHDDFDNSEIDEQWRNNSKEILLDLYNSLKTAGMDDPLSGMHISTRSLFKALKIKVD